MSNSKYAYFYIIAVYSIKAISFQDSNNKQNDDINIIVDFSGIGSERFNELKKSERDSICMIIGKLVMKNIETLSQPMTYIEKTKKFYNVVEHSLHCR